MKTLLMIESWCFASGILLPRAIRTMGHRFLLLTRCPQLYAAYAPAGEEHPVLALAEQVLECDTNDLAALTARALLLADSMTIDGVLTSCDYYLVTAAHLARRLHLPGPDPEALYRAGNKHLMRQRLAASGRPGPRFATAATLQHAAQQAAQLGYPLMVKPADGNASSLVERVDNQEALQAAVTAILAQTHNSRGQPCYGLALLESCLEGEEFSVEVCAVRGQYHVLGMTDKLLGGTTGCVELGHMFPAALTAQQAHTLRAEVIASLEALGYDHGMAHVEIRLQDDRATLIEVNPRLGGNYIAELVTLTRGISPLHCLIQLALGEQPPLQSQAGTYQSAAVRFLVANQPGTLQAVRGTDQARHSPGVQRLVIDAQVGQRVSLARDNNNYLGYVITASHGDPPANVLASAALAQLQLDITATG